jgi:hypothetical protein
MFAYQTKSCSHHIGVEGFYGTYSYLDPDSEGWGHTAMFWER